MEHSEAGYDDRQDVGGVVAVALMAVSLRVLQTVVRTSALLLTGQITGLLHCGQFDTFKSSESSNPFFWHWGFISFRSSLRLGSNIFI